MIYGISYKNSSAARALLGGAVGDRPRGLRQGSGRGSPRGQEVRRLQRSHLRLCGRQAGEASDRPPREHGRPLPPSRAERGPDEIAAGRGAAPPTRSSRDWSRDLKLLVVLMVHSRVPKPAPAAAATTWI